MKKIISPRLTFFNTEVNCATSHENSDLRSCTANPSITQPIKTYVQPRNNGSLCVAYNVASSIFCASGSSLSTKSCASGRKYTSNEIFTKLTKQFIAKTLTLILTSPSGLW